MRQRLPTIASMWSLALLTLLLSGCARDRHVTLSSAFPPPVMQQMKLAAGLRLSSEFRGYSHTETLADGRGRWTVPIGAASVDWISGLMRATFTEVEIAERASTQVRLVMVPSIEDVQFSLPAQSGTDFYEAWIRYRVQLLGPQGQALADWPIAAYGKARDSAVTSATAGLGIAFNNAMRDATAALALQIHDPRRMAALLAGPPPAAASGNAR